ncbi:hypothetical protein J7U46_19405 [Pelomonas sp. V22]|uniref:hypothetical protein n=1 Tax=Pelomonas sp. V22 TaxID=2822139 RepID=UPI0024A8D770|nr:hypothetical protein [Pelomonas sp. V22]MDI4635239.1 hypothetical protein [Pelomonas sp. V22]
MLLTKRLRRWISSGVLLALLFMQLATAAYACPQLVKELQQSAMAMAMPGCEAMSSQMDQQQPQLCKAHCVKDAQSMGAATAPDLQPNPAALTLMLGFVEPVEPTLPALQVSRPAGAQAQPPGAPPLYLSLLILRN